MTGLDGLGHFPVECDSSGTGQAFVEGGPDKSVRETTTAAPCLDDEPRLGRFLQSGEELLFIKASGRLDYGKLELGPHHGGNPEGPVGGLGKAGQPPADHVSDTFGYSQLGDRHPGGPASRLVFDSPGFGQVAQHFPHEKGVALGLLVDSPSQGEALFVQ